MHLNDKHKWQNFGCDTHLFLSLRLIKLRLIEKNENYFLEAWSLRITPQLFCVQLYNFSL